ncbi:MAG: polyphenol oxidase family protein [Elusimicrobiota bacterium]
MKDPGRRREALAAAGLGPEVFTLSQVHGTRIHRPVEGLDGAEGDGWLSDEPGRCMGVFVADCLPLFMWSESGGSAGVFHAGWRGVADGIAGAAVRAFADLGCAGKTLAAAVGPHIGACCYEVGPELRERFSGESFRDEAQTHLDLGREVAAQLVAAGLDPGRISVSGDCTACGVDKFFSYRRDGKMQRMLAWIAVPA